MSTGSTDGLKHVVIMRIVKSEEQLNKYINRHHIQDLFSPEYYDTYRKHLVLVHFDKNEFIYKNPGEDISYLYFFVEGKAKVITTLSNGKRQLLFFYTNDGILGDLEMFNLSNPYTTVQAATSSYCIGLNIRAVRSILESDPVFLYNLAKNLAFKLSRSSSNSSLNMYYPLENRLCSFINTMAAPYPRNPALPRIYKESLSETAEVLGTSYRHLQRTLKGLCEQGIIQKEGKAYRVIDEKALSEKGQDIFIDEYSLTTK